MPAGQVHQHGVAGSTFDQSRDRGLVGFAHDQIALPMAWYRTVGNRGGPVRNHEHRIDEPLTTLIRGTVRFTPCTSSSKRLGHFPFEATAGLEVQRLVDRFVTHTHARVLWVVLDQTI